MFHAPLFPGKIVFKREIKLWYLKVSTEFSGENKQNIFLCKYCLQKQISSKIITKTDGRCTFFLEYEREIMSSNPSSHSHHIKCLVNQASNISFCAWVICARQVLMRTKHQSCTSFFPAKKVAAICAFAQKKVFSSKVTIVIRDILSLRLIIQLLWENSREFSHAAAESKSRTRRGRQEIQQNFERLVLYQ